jgi:LPS export ABC transporter protein LptC
MKISFSLLIFFLLLFFGCNEKRTDAKKVSDVVDYSVLPDQISWDVEVSFIDSSFTKAILKARRARIFQKRQETLLDSFVHVDFISRTTNNVETVLTSDSARIDDKTRNMLATGHVVVVSLTKNTRLETSVLNWDNKTQKLFSTEFVKVISPKETIQGWGFESDQNLSYYKIFKVSGVQK